MSDQVTGDERSELDKALDGGIADLPPNVPPGMLGEKGINLYKVDDEPSHGLNAGVTQEVTSDTRVFLVLILYFLFFPASFVYLWASKHFSLKGKVVLTSIMLVGLAALAYILMHPEMTTG